MKPNALKKSEISLIPIILITIDTEKIPSPIIKVFLQYDGFHPNSISNIIADTKSTADPISRHSKMAILLFIVIRFILP